MPTAQLPCVEAVEWPRGHGQDAHFEGFQLSGCESRCASGKFFQPSNLLKGVGACVDDSGSGSIPCSCNEYADYYQPMTMYLLKDNAACSDGSGALYKRYVLTGQSVASCQSLCLARTPVCRGVQFLTDYNHCHLLVDLNATLSGVGSNIQQVGIASGPATSWVPISEPRYQCYTFLSTCLPCPDGTRRRVEKAVMRSRARHMSPLIIGTASSWLLF